MTDIIDPLVAPDPVTTKWIPLGNVGSGVPLPAVNGQWIKGVGGVPVWSSIGVGDLPTGIPPANIGGGYAPNKVTVGTLAAGPPASPATNDIWIATDVDANGTCWMFRFNGASASAYKWEYIGGSPVTVLTTTFTMVGDGAWHNAASFTLVRAGEYVGRPTSSTTVSVALNLYAGIGVNGTVSATSGSSYQAQANGTQTVTGWDFAVAVSAGGTINGMYLATGASTANSSQVGLTVTPKRIA